MVDFLLKWIEISVIDSCNRHCYFCPKSNEDEFPNTGNEVSIGLIQKLSDELEDLGFNGTIMLAGYGEPLLNRDICRIVSILYKNKNIKVEIVTNGDYLNVETIRNLFSCGLDKLKISMYGGTFQIKYFLNMIEDSGVQRDKIELRERWFDFGTITNRAGTINNKAYLDKECYYPCYSTMIDWNGDVLLCPQDWRKKFKLGNISLDSLEKIWYSNNYTMFRRKLLEKKRSKLTPCKFCDACGTMKGEEEAFWWRKIYGID